MSIRLMDDWIGAMLAGGVDDVTEASMQEQRQVISEASNQRKSAVKSARF